MEKPQSPYLQKAEGLPHCEPAAADQVRTSAENSAKPVPHPLSLTAHPTVWTVVFAALFAALLSFLPIPGFLRPFPFQEKGVLPVLSAALFPQRERKTLDQIRHDVVQPSATARQEDLQALLAVSSQGRRNGDNLPEKPPQSANLPQKNPGGNLQASQEDDGFIPPAEQSESAISDRVSDPPENVSKNALNDPAFWLSTKSAPPLAWLAAGAKKYDDFSRIERFAARLGTKETEIAEVCLDEKPGKSAASSEICQRYSLDPFFDAIQQIVDGRRTAPVRIAHFGNSLIASDFVAATIRRELSDRYGTGGAGFLLVDRPTRISGNFDRTGTASEGWKSALLTDRGDRSYFGLTGARFIGGEDGKEPSVTFDIRGASSAEIFWLSRSDGGDIEVSIDGVHKTLVHTKKKDRTTQLTKVPIRPGAKTLSLKVKSGPAELYGVSIENGRPGIVHDTYGLAGGTADVFLQADKNIFAVQLQARNPSLVIIMLGGNEAYEMSRGWMSAAKAKATTDGFIERIQSLVPGASCLVTSQLDAGIRNASGDITPRPFAAEVRDIMRKSASDHGCAFWDMYEFMGGKGAAERWFQKKAMNEDLIHPRVRGAEVLGHGLVSALERARLRRPAVAEDMRRDPPGIGRPERIANFLRKLELLELKKSDGTVSAVQIGASHTAAHFFTDQMRNRLSEKFGGAGRGFVAAGKASKRLIAAGVQRELRGSWKIEDARDYAGTGIWGLTGIRAEGAQNASQLWRFGIDASSGQSRKGTLTLHWFDSPKLHGEISIRLDGKEAGRLRMGGVSSPRLRLYKMDVEGPTHTLEVQNESGPRAIIFGASQDLSGPGIRWDALGLPGATAMLADKFDKATFAAALADRHADLLVLFYGTNEAALEHLTAEEVISHYGALIGSFKAASPGADCLIIGPTDRLSAKSGAGGIAPSIDIALDAIREVAKAEGCAFWSSRRAMGGTRSMKRWQEAGLGNKDGVHLTPKGYQVLADALADALFQEYEALKATSAPSCETD